MANGKLFLIAQEFAREIDEEIKIPRVVGHQCHRENYNCDSPEDYYRVSIFIPFIEHFVSQLEERFLKHKALLTKIENILPNKIIKLNEMELNESIEIIMKQWPEDLQGICDNILKKEALLWKSKWCSASDLPTNFIDALNCCNESVFPNTFKMLHICATLPCTAASAERSFSTLKRIKPYLRNATGDDRLNGLASMAIHRDIKIDAEEIIDRFNEKDRRILL